MEPRSARCVDRSVPDTLGVRHDRESDDRNALGKSHQSECPDPKRLGRTLWHVCTTSGAGNGDASRRSRSRGALDRTTAVGVVVYAVFDLRVLFMAAVAQSEGI